MCGQRVGGYLNVYEFKSSGEQSFLAGPLIIITHLYSVSDGILGSRHTH